MPVSVHMDDRRKPDQIDATECDVHLERLTKRKFCLIVQTGQSRSHFTITSAEPLSLNIVEIDMNAPKHPTSAGPAP